MATEYNAAPGEQGPGEQGPTPRGTAKEGIAVVGAGGHAKVVISTLRAAGEEPVACFDSNPETWGKVLAGIPILGPPEQGTAKGYCRAILAIGDNHARQRLAAELGFEWATAIHPTAWVDPSARIGPGSVIFAKAVLQADCVLGRHVIVNTSATVDHDCRLGNFAHLGPGANLAGDVDLGEGAFLGTGSCAIPGVRVGAWGTVGAGGALIRDLPAGRTAVGVPARCLPSKGAS